MTVHERIRRFREVNNLTHQQFADSVGVSRGAVQQWEKEDGTAPNRNRQPVVAKFMGISVDELMTDTTADGITNQTPSLVHAAQPAIKSIDDAIRLVADTMATFSPTEREVVARQLALLAQAPDSAIVAQAVIDALEVREAQLKQANG